MNIAIMFKHFSSDHFAAAIRNLLVRQVFDHSSKQTDVRVNFSFDLNGRDINSEKQLIRSVNFISTHVLQGATKFMLPSEGGRNSFGKILADGIVAA